MADPLPELTVVTTRRDMDVWARLPKRSTGTVVFVYDDGAAYEVEFAKPFYTVTVAREDLLECWQPPPLTLEPTA